MPTCCAYGDKFFKYFSILNGIKIKITLLFITRSITPINLNSYTGVNGVSECLSGGAI